MKKTFQWRTWATEKLTVVPTSMLAYWIGSIVAASLVISVLVRPNAVFLDTLAALVMVVFSAAIVIQFFEGLSKPSSKLSKAIGVVVKHRKSYIYKVTLLFFTAFVGAIAYWGAQLVVGSTINLPPEKMFNSVAVMTPIMSVFIGLCSVLAGLICFLLLYIILLIANGLWDQARPMANTFYAVWLAITGRSAMVKEVLGGLSEDSRKTFPVSLLVGLVCLIICSGYVVGAFSGVLGSDSYKDFRTNMFVYLDYNKLHHCSSQIGDGYMVNQLTDELVSSATLSDGKWRIETKKCLYWTPMINSKN